MRSLIRVCLASVLAPVGIIGATREVSAASQDSVTGSGSAGTGTFTVDAVSSPSGASPSGTLSFNLAIGTIAGPVTCVHVVGNAATVGGTADASSTIVAAGTPFVLHAVDNAGVGPPDILRLELGTSGCPEPSLISPSPVTAGDLVIVDAVEACQPPSLAVAVKPSRLREPDHKYRKVRATLSTSNDVTRVALVSATSDEPDNGPNDGNTVHDIVVVDDLTVRLRAERSTTGDGRTYTLTWEATNACGATASATATVVVPLGQRH